MIPFFLQLPAVTSSAFANTSISIVAIIFGLERIISFYKNHMREQPPPDKTYATWRAHNDFKAECERSFGRIDTASTIAWALSATLGLAASIRNTRGNKRLAVGISKSLDVGRRFLKETEEGKKLDVKLKEKLAAHQAEMGIARQVRDLLADHVR